MDTLFGIFRCTTEAKFNINHIQNMAVVYSFCSYLKSVFFTYNLLLL